MQSQESAPEIPDKTRLDFSPVHQLQNSEKEIIPIFVARAGLDRPTLNQIIDRFIQMVLSKNATVEISNHASGRHGFDILDDAERSRQVIRWTIDFIRSHS